MDGAAWPDPDRGHVEGALVDEFPLVEASGDGAELLELGKAALGLPTPIPPGGRGTAGHRRRQMAGPLRRRAVRAEMGALALAIVKARNGDGHQVG